MSPGRPRHVPALCAREPHRWCEREQGQMPVPSLIGRTRFACWAQASHPKQSRHAGTVQQTTRWTRGISSSILRESWDISDSAAASAVYCCAIPFRLAGDGGPWGCATSRSHLHRKEPGGPRRCPAVRWHTGQRNVEARGACSSGTGCPFLAHQADGGVQVAQLLSAQVLHDARTFKSECPS